MFVELQREILELFVEIQADVANQRHELYSSRLEFARTAYMRVQRAGAKRRNAELRTARLARPKWEPPKPAVRTTACMSCGAPIEWRQGCKTPVPHRCRRREAA
jgi:hypothetical protein